MKHSIFSLALCFAVGISLPYGLRCTVAQEASSALIPLPASVARFEEQAKKKWETEIQKFEALDLKEPDPQDAVLLLGSSSIRLWEDAATDLAPFNVVRRGYGGAKYSDLAVYAERLVRPHKFRAAVIYVGNDVTGGEDDRTPAEVAELVQHVLSVITKYQPNADVFLVEVTPTQKRAHVWKEIRAVNAQLREICLTRPHTFFVATAEYYLDEHDEPRPELFRDDKLHQNRSGYTIWSRIIKRQIEEQSFVAKSR